ncbi:MAG: hypothetical protein ACLFWD_03155 [Anaerolineales bacterium]
MYRQKTTPSTLLIALLAISAMLLAACGGATTEAPAPTEAPIETATSEPTEEGSELSPSVSVSDQEMAEGTVTVDSVTAAQAGWMVIHADADGAPGPVIGHAAVDAGTTENVTVEVDSDAATSTLYAMLHVDTGTEGEYEFPDADPPARVDDQIVVQPFEVSMGSAMEASGVTVETADHDPGTILVGPEGLTLYLLTADSPGESTCADGCADAWPPLTTEGEPQAGEGVDASLLGTLTREDSSSQVTYNGWPLYYYSGDANPGDAGGQGFESFGGTWWVLGPDGNPVDGESAGSGSGDGNNGDDVDDLY